MSIKVINPPDAAPPLAPYSRGTRGGNTIYVAGTCAFDAQGKTVGVGDIRAQTRHVLEAIKKVIEAGGGAMADVAMNHIFLTDMNNYKGMNEVYAEYFPKNPPARYCVLCKLVRDDFLVEIASVAHV